MFVKTVFLSVMTIFLSCSHELDMRLVPIQQNEFVKIEQDGSYYVQFEQMKKIEMIEVDRLLNGRESLEIELCDYYKVEQQQTIIIEQNQSYCIIHAKVQSPIYVAFR